MPQFAIVIRNRDADWTQKSESELRSIYESYYAWVADLEQSGHYLHGHALTSTGRSLREVDGRVTDGPFAETKEVVGGFFIVDAEDLRRATELARRCPALRMGDGVDVRPLSENPARFRPG